MIVEKKSNVNNRKIWVMLIILLLLVAFIAASCLIFLIKVVDCQIISSPNFSLNEQQIQDITKDFKGQSYIFFSTNKAKQEIEQKYPYVKVEKIEKDFPNVLVVWISEKYEIFAASDGEEFKVLSIDQQKLRISNSRLSNRESNLILLSNFSSKNAQNLNKIVQVMLNCQSDLNVLNICDVFDEIEFLLDSCKITFCSGKNYEVMFGEDFEDSLRDIFEDENNIF